MENKVIIWLHMHQPEYFDPVSGIQYLPWVRRHLLKGYYTVGNLLKKYPAKININFSGILLKQIKRYTENLTDYYDYLERKDANSLTESEVSFIISKFLTRINGFNQKRFIELINKKEKREKFTTNDLRDTQILFTLSAFSALNKNANEFLKKERNFTESDKEEIKKIEKETIESILPLYKELSENGTIELTITPMYHPILPLLIDTNSAKESKPDSILPVSTFTHPEDADMQIKEGIEIFEQIFGKKPEGMWPSEGSVSEKAIEITEDNKIQWIGTDEEVLKRSLNNADKLVYSKKGIKMIFRNHSLSDKIAFTYNKINPSDAASDFKNYVQNSNRTEVVILDGENPWDYYENGGINFLTEWFKALEKISILGSEAETEGEIEHITPGSWINGFFDTWIGHKESNTAWEYLTEAREKLKGSKNAMKELYIAEGSDWFWWYSDFHKNEVDFSFDHLFRMHLIKAYELSGEIIPGYLFYPIKEEK